MTKGKEPLYDGQISLEGPGVIKLLCITGTRADYGIYRPLLKRLTKEGDIHVQLVVTGMHLLPEFGRTIEEVKQDPYPIVAAPAILLRGDSTYAMAQSVGLAALYLADIFHYHQPDAVLLLGDRGEMLAAALTAHYQNVPIIHLHGGEKSGTGDDAVRHAISKLAHLHVVSTIEARQVLIHMGEAPWRICAAGSLRKHDIERIKGLSQLERERLNVKYGLSVEERTVLVVMHPDPTEAVPIPEQIDVLLKALRSFPTVYLLFIGPNSDAGGDQFRSKMLSFSQEQPNARYFPTVPADEFLYLLSQSDLLVGNSSSGMIEAPFFHLPVINIGRRQEGRVHGKRVYHVSYDAGEIEKVVNKILAQGSLTSDSLYDNPYDLVPSPADAIHQFIRHRLQNRHLLKK